MKPTITWQVLALLVGAASIASTAQPVAASAPTAVQISSSAAPQLPGSPDFQISGPPDRYILDESERVVRELIAKLRGTLVGVLPSYHAVFSYIPAPYERRLVRLPSPVVSFFAIGAPGAMRGSPGGPANWTVGDSVLGGLRFLTFRPSLASATADGGAMEQITNFPTSDANVVVQFKNLDLEFRFQIVTSNSRLRSNAANIVRNGLDILHAADSIAGRAARYRLSIDTIRARCSALLGTAPSGSVHRDCRISEIDSFGVVDGEEYFYAIYCVVPNHALPENGLTCGGESFNARYNHRSAVAVFTRAVNGQELKVPFSRESVEAGGLVYDPPVIAQNAAGTMLQLTIPMSGTGNYNASEYYLRTAGGWQLIESEEWMGELTVRLPMGLRVGKGVWPDLTTLRAEAGLYKTGDGNCCPTGGSARIQLAVREGRFVLQSVDVIPP